MPYRFLRRPRARAASVATMLVGLALALTVLAACATASARPVTQRPSNTLTPAVTVTPAPTATITPAPTATPRPTVAPPPAPKAPPPQAPPPILDVRPSGMSIVGHLDCTRNGAFICQAAVVSRSANQTALHWTSFTNVPGHIAFSPAGGVLAPGQTLLVTITVPLNACTRGLFFFRGPANTHTISWAC